MSNPTPPEPASPSRARRVVSTSLKALLSAALLYWVFRRVDLERALATLAAPHTGPLVLAVVCTLLQWPATGLRWHLLLREVGAPLPVRRSLGAQLGSLLMSQVLPTVGGDAWRIVAVRRAGRAWSDGVTSVLLDRLFALTALAALVAATHPWLLAHAPRNGTRTLVTVGLAATCAALLVAFFGDRLLSPLAGWRIVDLVRSTSGTARRVLGARSSVVVLGLSLAAHLLTAAAVYFLARALDLNVNLLDALVLVPPVVLLSALPISLAGWGVREGSMVALFALVAVPRESALALSLASGFVQLACSLPGALVLATESSARDGA